MKKLQPRGFAFLLLLLVPCSLSGQTRVDTLYSVAALDGEIGFHETSGFLDATATAFGFIVGDAIVIDEGPMYSRGYLSFDLSSLPAAMSVDSVLLSVRQHGSMGNGHFGWYPKWDVPGGDTIFCIVDHVEYGVSLDTTDWTAGDPGDPQTLAANIGILSKDSLVGFKTLSVTEAICRDRQAGRSRSQFRVRFPVLTDHDGLNDDIGFGTGEYPPSVAPRLVIWSTVTSTAEDDAHPNGYSLYQNFPNPFNPTTTIEYSIPKRQRVSLKVVNTLGEEVATLVSDTKDAGHYSTVFDARGLPSGVYFVMMRAETTVQSIKCVLMK